MVADQIVCFSSLRGHAKAKELIRRCLQSGRIPHAFLFRGPEGVGKTLFARGVAAALNCRRPTGPSACGKCSSCHKMISANHPDFQVIRPENGVMKIDQIRELGRSLSYPPYESKIRVTVLEDVGTMRREAANALLKTLEEPPEDNLLILTVEDSQQILPTLVSRCQLIPFGPLTSADTSTILTEHGIGGDDAILLARLAEGSPGRALMFHDGAMLPLWQELIAYLEDPAKDPDRDLLGLLEIAEKMAQLKETLIPFLGLVKIWLRDRLVQQTQGYGPVFPASSRKDWSSGELFAKLRHVTLAEQRLQRNCNRTMVCEVLLFLLQQKDVIAH